MKNCKKKSRLFGGVEVARATIILPKDLYERAKHQGLNLSIVLRNALEDILSRLEGYTPPRDRCIEKGLSNGGMIREEYKPRAGLEPATCGLQDRCSAS